MSWNSQLVFRFLILMQGGSSGWSGFRMLVLLLTGLVTFGNLYHLSESQSCHLWNGMILISSGLLWTLDDTSKVLEKCKTWCMHVCTLTCFSRVWLFATPWTVALQAPLSMGFPGQKCWSGLPRPAPGDLSDPGVEPSSPASPALQALKSLLMLMMMVLPLETELGSPVVSLLGSVLVLTVNL